MFRGFKIQDKSIAQQVAAIRWKYKSFSVNYDAATLKASGIVQPTSRSDQYTIEIKYHLREQPRVFVVKPQLVENFNRDKIPHIYPGKRLCLYQPKYREYKFADLIADTIIPWTSLWLYHYEVWHNTGTWLGGGEHIILEK